MGDAVFGNMLLLKTHCNLPTQASLLQPTFEAGIMAEGVLGLGHANGQLVISQSGEALNLGLCLGTEAHTSCPIGAHCNGLNLLLQAGRYGQSARQVGRQAGR